MSLIRVNVRFGHIVSPLRNRLSKIFYMYGAFSLSEHPSYGYNNVVDPGRTAISISTTCVLLNDSQMERDTFVSFSKLMSRLKRSDMVNILINFNSNKKMFQFILTLGKYLR